MRSRKGTMVGDPAVSFALCRLTKDTLVDLVHGLALERLGPGAHGPDVVSLLQEWAYGIGLVRGEVLPSIEAGVARYRKIEEECRAAASPDAADRAEHEGGRAMSEGVEIGFDAEVLDLGYRMQAAEERLAGLVRTMDGAREGRVRIMWRLIERLVALEKERPGARWRVGGTVYWLEDARLCSEPADPR